MRQITKVALAAATLTLPVPAFAQDWTLGQAEYMNSCAQCHGTSGAGDGAIAGFLSVSMPDLTQLQKNNGGVFPFARVFGVIEGSVPVGVHGTVDMPTWGQRYAAKAPAMLGLNYSEADQEAFVRARILALAEFIATMQEQ